MVDGNKEGYEILKVDSLHPFTFFKSYCLLEKLEPYNASPGLQRRALKGLKYCSAFHSQE